MIQYLKSKSVIHITDTLEIGGAEKMLIEIANKFKKEGHKVSVMILLKKKNPLISKINKDINVYELERKSKYNLFFAKNVIKIINMYDIVHIHMRHNLRYVWYAKIFFGLKSKIIFHDHIGKKNLNDFPHFINKTFFKDCIYIGVDKRHCDWVLKNKILPKNKIYHVSNVLNQKKITNYSYCKQKNRNIILVSNLTPHKNIEFAIRVIKHLHKLNFDVELDIIGQIIEANYLLKLKNEIVENGLQNKIHFIHNCIEIQNIIHKYSMGIHTSYTESGPLVLIEYLAQNLPFLTYRTGDVVDKLILNFPELIQENFEVQLWASKIIKIMSDENYINRKKLKLFYDKNFSMDSYYKTIYKIYQ